MSIQLLTFSQQQAILKISSNNESIYTDVYQITRFNDLPKLLSDKFLQEIESNFESEDGKYFELLNGGVNSEGVRFEGLRFIIANYNYANYIPKSRMKDTFVGMQANKLPNSESIGFGEVEKTCALYRNMADSQFRILKVFIKDNFETFDQTKTKKVFSPKCEIVTRNSYNRD